MILAIDVHYRQDFAKAVGVLFNWDDEQPQEIINTIIENAEEYIPGQFYKRELPSILKIIEKVNSSTLDVIIIDGHVYIDDQENYGLGAHLYYNLNEKIPVIGVAKTSFHTNHKTIGIIYRGESRKPLYVSTIGIDKSFAIEQIRNMKGKYRIPSILKQLDTITKID